MGDFFEAGETADWLRAVLSGPYEVAGTSIEVGVSIGIALVPGDGQDPEGGCDETMCACLHTDEHGCDTVLRASHCRRRDAVSRRCHTSLCTVPP